MKRIYGIGLDVEDVAPFRMVLKNGSIVKKIYTDKELGYCKSRPSPELHLAARFAGKVAILKALGPKHRNITLGEIEIRNRKDGAPFIDIKKRSLKKDFSCLISLSHSNTRALAFSVITDRG